MDKQLEERIRAHNARRQADEAIRALGNIDSSAAGGTYLVSDFRRRDDLPTTASLRRMSTTVAKKLAEMGLREPVSLQSVTNRWWKVKVDAAELGLVSEYGNAFVTRILSTKQVMDQGFEVEDGPFAAWENNEVSRAILRGQPGKFWDARIYQVAMKPGEHGQPYFFGADNGYTSEALIAALDQGDSIQVFSGPFESQDDAHYALDVRWEVPK